MTQPETARALLHRHGLPEDIIDGALCLHAQELAAVQRAALAKTDDPVFYEGEAGWLVNLIEPSRTPAAVSAAVAPPTDRAAVLHEAADRFAAFDLHAEAAALRRMADETATTETLAEDPARIDRLRPEFFEHASVESIDAQIRRAQRQQRQWGNRERTLAILRQARVMQKEHGEWPAAGARVCKCPAELCACGHHQPAAGARQDGAES